MQATVLRLAAIGFAGGEAALAAANDSLRVEGTEFVLRHNGEELRSTDLVGAEIDLENGNTLRIDQVRSDSNDPSIFLHRFSLKSVNGDWFDPCEANLDGESEGFPLPGYLDDQNRFHIDADHFTLTCTSGAQGKCVRFGYKPWATSVDNSPLLPLYEACIRMVRADYCGDMEAFTRDGTIIDIYDDHGVQQSESGPDFRFEAGWSPEGALCVSHTRMPEILTLKDLAERCPRLANALGESCTEEAARDAGAILFNKSK